MDNENLKIVNELSVKVENLSNQLMGLLTAVGTLADAVDKQSKQLKQVFETQKNVTENFTKEPKPALKISDIMDIFGVSKPTAYEMANRRGFPAFKDGNKIIISYNGLVQWIDKNAGEY